MGNLPFVENPHKHILYFKKKKKQSLKAEVTSPLKARSLALLREVVSLYLLLHLTVTEANRKWVPPLSSVRDPCFLRPPHLILSNYLLSCSPQAERFLEPPRLVCTLSPVLPSSAPLSQVTTLQEIRAMSSAGPKWETLLKSYCPNKFLWLSVKPEDSSQILHRKSVLCICREGWPTHCPVSPSISLLT